jgi:hypothetical protein
MAKVEHVIGHHVLKPLTNTVYLLQILSKKYPQEANNLNEQLSEWENVRRTLQGLMEKVNRDLNTTPARWNLHDILNQELQFIETITDYENVKPKTSFGAEKPFVFGLGCDFSIILGPVLKSVLYAWQKMNRTEILVHTKTVDNQLFVEMPIPNVNLFKVCLCKTIDPNFEDKDTKDNDKIEESLLGFHSAFDAISGHMDIGNPEENKALVRIRIPLYKDKNKVKQAIYSNNIRLKN